MVKFWSTSFFILAFSIYGAYWGIGIARSNFSNSIEEEIVFYETKQELIGSGPGCLSLFGVRAGERVIFLKKNKEEMTKALLWQSLFFQFNASNGIRRFYNQD